MIPFQYEKKTRHKIYIDENSNLKAPIICIFVRIISDLATLFFKLVTTSTVAFANKSSDRLEERDAEEMKKNLMRRIQFCFHYNIFNQIKTATFSGLKTACFKVFHFEISYYMH